MVCSTEAVFEGSLEGLPVAALGVRSGCVVAANAGARSLLGRALALGGPVAQVLGTDFRVDGPTPCRILLGPEDAPLELEVAVGAPDAGDARILVLHDLSGDAAVRSRLERGLAFERLLTRSSAELMRSAGESLDGAIEGVLGDVGRFFGVDRAYVFLVDESAQTQSNSHEWVAQGISREREHLQHLPLDVFPCIVERLRADDVFRFDSIADLPPEAANERVEFERQGIRSILIVPLWTGGVLRGYVGFDAVRTHVAWSDSYVVGLRLLAQMVAGALESREMARRLRRQAMHDAVTGLPNRLFLRDRFEESMRALGASGRLTATVALIDVDDFKVVNDRFGHACGDALLRELGRRLEAVAGGSAVVARIGGDEFVVMDPHGVASIPEFADRLLEAAARPFEVTGGTHSTGVSIGLVRGVHEADELDTLLDRADAAMYRAKSSGKNRWALAGALAATGAGRIAGSTGVA